MQTLRVELGERAYPIHIGEHLLSDASLVTPHPELPKVAIVNNTTVAALYLQQLSDALRAQGVDVISIVLEDGERYKVWSTLNRIYDVLLERRCERKTTLVALCRRDLHARHAFYPGSDDPARPGRFLHRRQDRD